MECGETISIRRSDFDRARWSQTRDVDQPEHGISASVESDEVVSVAAKPLITFASAEDVTLQHGEAELRLRLPAPE